NAGERERRRIALISQRFRERTMAVLRIAFLSSAVLEFFAAISIALVAVFIGFRLLDGEMQFLYGFFVLLLAPELYLPLRELGAQNHARMEAVAAAQHMVGFLERDALVATGAGERDESPAATPPSGDMVIQDVHFEYEPGRRALDGVSLSFKAGTTTALVGPSGAGKSTLAHALLGFVKPDTGEVRIGDWDIHSTPGEHWQSAIAWVPQRPRLFATTVLENIRLAKPGATRKAVEEAARRAQAFDFIEGLPKGLDTLIGEGGRSLSGGEAQRIAIARALLRDSPYVVMDEPTAHLDGQSQAAVHAAIAELAKGRTLLIIAHRLETVKTADHIVVMDAGQVVQSGDWTSLTTEPGLF
ncbi:MAG: ABC transporter ATP-binding protein/permease, partial [Gammaproteobacteria bacterium]